MVSKNPNSESGFYIDPTGAPLPGITTSDQDPNSNSKKIRKPYTITKSRENWTEPEHDKFLEALQLFDRDWKKIEAFVGSKTVIQIRSHAQKYFLKAQKSGKGEHLPPPRPKRKAAHPYPQKAAKNVSAPPQTVPFQSSAAVPEPGYILSPNSLPILRVPVSSASIPSRSDDTVPKVKLSNPQTGPGVGNNCCSSSESTPARPVDEKPDQGVISRPSRVLPDFTQVYSFIGSVFDPDSSCHVQRLKKMDRIDVETVLLLMKNLSINLCSPDFENQRKLLSSYELGSEMTGEDDAM